LMETKIPFGHNEQENTYELRICKGCRADFIRALIDWF
jgi:hypothetical protein